MRWKPKSPQQRESDYDARKSIGKPYLGGPLRQGPSSLRMSCHLAGQEISIAEAADQGHQLHYREQEGIGPKILDVQQSCDEHEDSQTEQPPNHLGNGEPAGISHNTS